MASDPSPPPAPLSSRARRFLRALGHELEPVIQVGKQGLTEAVVREAASALRAHELIKVRIGQQAPEDRHELAAALASATASAVAQVLGRTVLLYKRHPKKPKIALPGEKLRATAPAAGSSPRRGPGANGARRGEARRPDRGER